MPRAGGADDNTLLAGLLLVGRIFSFASCLVGLLLVLTPLHQVLTCQNAACNTGERIVVKPPVDEQVQQQWQFTGGHFVSAVSKVGACCWWPGLERAL